MIRKFLIPLLLFTFFTSAAFAQVDSLRAGIERSLASKNAHVGVAVTALDSFDTLSIHGAQHFPMQSVFKFPIAMAVLNEVDKRRLSLNQKILITKADLLPRTWSPLREKYPNGNVRIPLSEILQYTVSQSDNNGCDILLRLIKGTKIVNDYIHKKGIKEIAIVFNEEEMHKEWNVQFSNWITPKASNDLLKLFYDRKILSAKSRDFLWKIMMETSTGNDRIKGQLPTGTKVAHKTGTSDTNNEGVTAAINDVGIVTLPNGKHFAISVFVSDSKENNKTNEKIISDISKLAWDYFVSKNH
jgi:beta-lactamase class A